MITIYQIQTTETQYNAFNAGASVPELEAKRKLIFCGSKNFTQDMLKYFTPVYEVDTDDFEKAFELTNLWNNGHLVRALPGTRGHSSSVGDIFVMGDKVAMVDTWGFAPLFLFADEVEMLEAQ